jgi:alkanesulfonate monooxygenase SsuD/methylene tetrahydromethanopterin reductase-like flavin-dependent oxidoreductase (luciferase family)
MVQVGLLLSDVPRSVSPSDQFKDVLRIVDAAQRNGFTYIAIGQHFLYGDLRWLQPVPLLARLAAEVDPHIRLVTQILIAPLYHPVMLAEEIATLDVVTEGRLIFGAGLGYRPEEFDYLGVPYKERAGRFDESLELMTRLWTEETVTFHGKYWTLDDVHPHLFPVQQPHPPIWIGGGGEQITLRIVARLADKANFGGKPEEWTHKRDVLFGHCKDVGRDPDEIELTWSPEVCVRDSEDEIRELVKAGKASRWGEPYDSWQAGNLVGTPEQVMEKVRTYIDLGCTYFVPWCSDYPDDTTLRVLADKVMPEFR